MLCFLARDCQDTLLFIKLQRNTVPFSVQSKCPAWYHGSHFLASLLRELSYQELQRAEPISAWKGWHPAPALRMVPPACLPSGSDPQYSNNSAFSPLDE